MMLKLWASENRETEVARVRDRGTDGLQKSKDDGSEREDTVWH
jgi:hypothetical protein